MKSRAKRSKKDRILLKKLDKLALKIAKLLPELRQKSIEMDIFLLGEAEMKKIKKKFLPGEKGPANVLSFGEPSGWPMPESRKKKLGEVYLNIDITGGKLEKLVPLLSHGILHLLGYDHKRKNDRIRMEKTEKKVIEKLRY